MVSVDTKAEQMVLDDLAARSLFPGIQCHDGDHAAACDHPCIPTGWVPMVFPKASGAVAVDIDSFQPFYTSDGNPGNPREKKRQSAWAEYLLFSSFSRWKKTRSR